MAILSMTAVAEALKSFYLPGLRYQLNEQASVFLSQVERDSESVVGKEIIMALRYGRSGGIGNRADDGDLPTPNSRKTKQAKWETKNIFARFQISDKTIAASKSNVGAFANMLEQEIKDCETDAKLDLSRQALGDGAGILATITGAKTGNTVPVDSTMYVTEGMLVDIWGTVGSAYVNQGVEITAVNDDTKTVTLSAVGTVANGDLIYVAGNKDMELTGLEGVMNNTTLYGVDRTAYPWFNATKININGEISEVGIQQAIDDAERKAGATTNFLLCSFGVRRAYQNLLEAQKRQVDTLNLQGGWRALSYNGIPLVADKYVKAGILYCLDLTDWKLYQMADWDWLDKDGAMLSRVSGKPVWEATLVRYCDLGCSRPRGQVKLYGIVEH